MKIMVNGQPCEEPKVLAEEFVKSFKKKVDDLAKDIKAIDLDEHLEPEEEI